MFLKHFRKHLHTQFDKTYKTCKYTPRTQMTLILIEKGLVLEGSTPKIEDKQVPGR